MRISGAAYVAAVSYSRDKQQSVELANQSNTPQESGLSALSAVRFQIEERVSLNSSQATSVYSQSTMGATVHQQQWQQQQLFSRNYSSQASMELLFQPATADGELFSGSRQSVQSGQYYRYQDMQQISVNLSGLLTTDDGQQIEFQYAASASQSFSFEYGRGEYAERVSVRKDPLIVNYSGGFNNLSSQSYDFDLDSDGKTETISFAGVGSGFLALDINNDGVINNGSELFGASSGDGFSELSKYDEDGNGFIDAGDSVYSQLKIYTKAEAGEEQLFSLEQLQIAAIGLESVSTPFRVADQLNNELGMVRSTGIFVRADGSVDSVQQIDLTQRNVEAEERMQRAFSAESDVDPMPSSEQQGGSSAELDNMMAQLKWAQQERLDRQDQLAQTDQDERPKSLLEQLVETFEAYTAKQIEDRQAKDDKGLNAN